MTLVIMYGGGMTTIDDVIFKQSLISCIMIFNSKMVLVIHYGNISLMASALTRAMDKCHCYKLLCRIVYPQRKGFYSIPR